jgi:hypothetical protein
MTGHVSYSTQVCSVVQVGLFLYFRECAIATDFIFIVDYEVDHAEAHGRWRYGRVIDNALYTSWSL